LLSSLPSWRSPRGSWRSRWAWPPTLRGGSGWGGWGGASSGLSTSWNFGAHEGIWILDRVPRGHEKRQGDALWLSVAQTVRDKLPSHQGALEMFSVAHAALPSAGALFLVNPVCRL